ncbi:hypothetical protein [Actinopolyspora mortivallis]|uniref:Uncharacterized protein n=1 Tax=Actinopolyspora mortivallis TaxID=33906 RepID=A0A2T0GWN6_ACTMO|nr:hypothetical protein [Actinopolyspora mortivallis]PRW63526.1 hypothetical protein CEP50_10030 [Actinopolyspora mortivallis]
MRTTTRVGLAAGMALGCLVPGAAMAATEAETPAARTITKITCFNTQDWPGADETFIRVTGGANLWGPTSMSENDSKNPNVRVHDGTTIGIWDDDGPGGLDDLIGRVTVRSGKHSYDIQGNGASYGLYIR